MSLALQPIFFTTNNPKPSTASSPLSLSSTHLSKPLSLQNLRFLTPRAHISRKLPKINASLDEPYGASPSPARARADGGGLDSFLSVLEILSLASSAAISVYVVLGRNGAVLGSGGIWAWQCVVLVGGACVGAVMRRRQWRRICGAAGHSGKSPAVNLPARIEKLEEDLRGAATIVRVLSRQIEKLGNRVRVTRKDLKEPISETAALAQKTSEVTRALAAKEDNLEKELSEIQKVLMAMQEQQQKQLELILAIGKASKLWETKSVLTTEGHNANGTSHSSDLKGDETETEALQKQADDTA